MPAVDTSSNSLSYRLTLASPFVLWLTAMDLIAVSRRLSRRIDELSFKAPVTHVYNPLGYARAPHEQYLRRYGERTGRVLLMGMNPGPFGMAQTGVPFGDVRMVRDFLGIEAPVGKPRAREPARPITGFACARSEVSGTRLWGWARDRFGTGRAVLPAVLRGELLPAGVHGGGRAQPHAGQAAAARAPAAAGGLRRGPARRTCSCCGPRTSSAWAASPRRAPREALADLGVPIGCILHPSPASPAANNDWAGQIERQLRALGIPLG